MPITHDQHLAALVRTGYNIDSCELAGCEGPVFLEWCPSCKRKHYMTMQPCPGCGGRGGWIAMPKSERVADNCFYLHYECEGCEAYREHMA